MNHMLAVVAEAERECMQLCRGGITSSPTCKWQLQTSAVIAMNTGRYIRI